MKIISYELYEVGLPTRRKQVWATSTVDVGAGYLLIKLKTDTGIEGWGESTAMAEWGGDFGVYYGETAKTTRVIFEDHLFPAIEGMDPFDIALIHTKMDKAVRGYPYAKSAVDIAIYDILGKALERPVHQLLGGCYRERIPVAHSLGLMDVDVAVNEAMQVVSEGVKHIKIKGGLDLKRDLELVKKLRENLGPDVTLGLDPNQCYPTAKEAIQWCTYMDEYNMFYVEQPVEGIGPMAAVTHALKIPVIADESCWTVADAINLIKNKACDMFSIYTAKPGGLYNARAIATIAEHAGIRCNVNGSGEFGIGNAAILHLASSARSITLPSVMPITCVKGDEKTMVAGRTFVDDIITRSFDYEDGHLIVPKGPGLGIEVDMNKIHQYSVE